MTARNGLPRRRLSGLKTEGAETPGWKWSTNGDRFSGGRDGEKRDVASAITLNLHRPTLLGGAEIL